MLEENYDDARSLEEEGERLTAQTTVSPKRANRKYNTDTICNKLLQSPRQNHKAYQASLRCCFILNQYIDKKIRSWGYCEKRHCSVCNAIKTAQLIDAYLPTLQSEQFKDAYFVTLTIKNTNAENLSDAIILMYQRFAEIIDNSRKKRSGRVQLHGIKKLEITYNNDPNSDWFNTFHPHFHIVVQTKAVAENLLSDWLQSTTFKAHIKGQHIKKADENSLKELFKYISKLHFTDGNDSPESDARLIESIDVIMNAILNKKIFSAFGNVKPVKKQDIILSTGIDVKKEEPIKTYQWKGYDWEEKVKTEVLDDEGFETVYDEETGNYYEIPKDFTHTEFVKTGKMLTGFIPKKFTKEQILQEEIDETIDFGDQNIPF